MQGQPVESFSAAMIKAAREGERAAQAALLRGMQDQWYRMLLRLLGGAGGTVKALVFQALRNLRQSFGVEKKVSLRRSLGSEKEREKEKELNDEPTQRTA